MNQLHSCQENNLDSVISSSSIEKKGPGFKRTLTPGGKKVIHHVFSLN